MTWVWKLKGLVGVAGSVDWSAAALSVVIVDLGRKALSGESIEGSRNEEYRFVERSALSVLVSSTTSSGSEVSECCRL